jgi:tetratricopeptide (TPR) repeat protein
MLILQIGLALVAFVITAWIFFKERPQAQVNQQLQQQLTQAQQTNQQLEQRVSSVQNDRKQSREYLRAGRDLLHQQKYDEAISQYDKALQAFPDDPYGWSLKGYAQFRAGHIPESIESNKKAIQLDPGDPLNYIDLAKSYCAAKQYQEAIHALLNDPPSDTAADVKHYILTDGEIRRVCRPILAQVSMPPGPITPQ